MAVQKLSKTVFCSSNQPRKTSIERGWGLTKGRVWYQLHHTRRKTQHRGDVRNVSAVNRAVVESNQLRASVSSLGRNPGGIDVV